MDKYDFSEEGREEFYKFIEEKKSIIKSLKNSELKDFAYKDLENTLRFYEKSRIDYLNDKIKRIREGKESEENNLADKIKEDYGAMNDFLLKHLEDIRENTAKIKENYLKIRSILEKIYLLKEKPKFTFNNNLLN